MKIFYEPHLTETIKELRARGLSKRNIIKVIQLAEISGEEVDTIISRYDTIEEATRVVMVS